MIEQEEEKEVDIDREERRRGCGLWVLFLAVFIVSFVFMPLFIVTVVMFIWLLLKPADQICPKCKFPNPIPR